MNTKKKVKIAAVLAACLTAFSLTACSAANAPDNTINDTTIDSETAETEKTEVETTVPETAQSTSAAEETTVPETVQSTSASEGTTVPEIAQSVSASEETTAVTESDDTPWQNQHIYRPDDNTRIDLFTSSISDDEGKEYALNVYMYFVDNGHLGTQLFPIEEGMLRGDVEAELLYNGEKLYALNLLIGGVGQVANSYYIPDLGSNFRVLHLDGGDVFVGARSDNSGLWFTEFYTVKDGRLKVMNRYFSDEEQKQIEENTVYKGIIPRSAACEFIVTDKFTVVENRIIYELDFETPGIQAYSYEIGSYPPGEIPLLFDFENNTVKCEKDEYAGLVYWYFDVV
ncbi:MAG: hypothetical protein NC228_03965 [[Eubacterium] siraeum]|nr:hypothetical protein [[Eubacterium] siraeum]